MRRSYFTAVAESERRPYFSAVGAYFCFNFLIVGGLYWVLIRQGLREGSAVAEMSELPRHAL